MNIGDFKERVKIYSTEADGTGGISSLKKLLLGAFWAKVKHMSQTEFQTSESVSEELRLIFTIRAPLVGTGAKLMTKGLNTGLVIDYEGREFDVVELKIAGGNRAFMELRGISRRMEGRGVGL